MNFSLSKYLSFETSLELATIRAKSFVMKPFSTVSIVAASNSSAKCFKASFLSNPALANKPLDQAKILAIEFVEVSLPY